MGSEGRSWNGVAGAGGRNGGEEKMGTAVVAAPAEVPTSAASVDISLQLPEMTPRIMQVCGSLSLSRFADGVWGNASQRATGLYIVAPFPILFFDMVDSFSRDLCKELVEGWSSLDSGCFSISTVSGGITNLCESRSVPVSLSCPVS
jgi:ethanolamine kinase